MTYLKTLAFALGLVASPMIAQVQQNPQPTQLPSGPSAAECAALAKSAATSSVAAKNEAGRAGGRLLGKIFSKAAKPLEGATGGVVKPTDVAQMNAETAAQKERERQELVKKCALQEEARNTPLAPAPTRVIEACPPNTSRAAGTPYCLKPDNTLVDLLHINVSVNPPVPSPTTSTPAPQAPAAPATAK